MRIVMLVAVLALAGCSNVREALGAYQKAADKGIGVETGAQAEASAADEPPSAPGAARRDLPASLGGDHENHVYATPPKR